MDKSSLILNENIKFQEVIVIDWTGKNIGLMDINMAVKTAKKNNMDLILINPGNDTRKAITKIVDVGKYLYEQKSKEKKARQTSSSNQFKQITVNAQIANNDLMTKVKQSTEWLKQGAQILFRIKATGRASNLVDLIEGVYNSYINNLKGVARVIAPLKKISNIYYTATIAKNK